MDTKIIQLTQGWKFHLGGVGEDFWADAKEGAGWQTVSVPHDWSVKYPFSKAYSSGTGYLCGGKGTYRKTFYLKPEDIGKKITLLFDGVYKNSRVWCNGCYKGKRPNGYVPFSYDLTNEVHEGDNVICVEVDHEDITDSRWFTGSGITRKVRLRIEEPLCIVHESLFFTTPEVTRAKADVQVTCEVSNETAARQAFSLKQLLKTAEGETVLDITKEGTLLAGEKQSIMMQGV